MPRSPVISQSSLAAEFLAAHLKHLQQPALPPTPAASQVT
jgi:hypothetical protein